MAYLKKCDFEQKCTFSGIHNPLKDIVVTIPMLGSEPNHRRLMKKKSKKENTIFNFL